MAAPSTFDPGPGAIDIPDGAIVLAVGDDYQAIVDAAPEGAVFVFAAGVHRLLDEIAPKDGQVFLGEEGAVLNGAREISDFERSGDLYVATGQIQEGQRHATEQAAEGAIRAGYPETFFVDGKPLRPVDSLAAVTAGTFYFDYDADRIYFADDPEGHTVEAGFSPGAFAPTAANVTIANLIVEMFDSPVQKGAIQGGEGWTVEHNEVRSNYGVGITVGAAGQILSNNVHDNGQMGLGGNGDGILVEGNAIHANGFWSGIDVFWEGGGQKFALTHDLIVRGNYSYGNHGLGLWTDIDNKDTLYEGNLLVGNDGGGISHEISYDAVIRDNIMVGNGYQSHGWLWGGQIQIQNSQNVEVYANRVDMLGGLNGITMILQNRGDGAYGPYITRNNFVHDNVLVSTGTSGASGGAADFRERALLNGANLFDHNSYFMPDGDHWWWGDFGGEGWTAYQDGTAQDAHSSFGGAHVNTIRWIARSPLSAADDVLRGGGGRDLFVGGRGDDTLDGGGARDTLAGGREDDLYRVDSARDRVLETAGQGRDTVEAGVSYVLESGQSIEMLRTADPLAAGRLDLTGNELANTLLGGAGANALKGGGGADLLRGAGSRDTLDGGAGADTLQGGDGADRFVFHRGQADADEVHGFSAAAGDRLVFAGYGPGASAELVDERASGGGLHIEATSGDGALTENVWFVTGDHPTALDPDLDAYVSFISPEGEYLLYS